MPNLCDYSNAYILVSGTITIMQSTLMQMYNSIEYSDNFSKTSDSLWQYYRDDPNNNIAESKSFKYKVKITGKTPADGITTMLK